MRTEVKQSTGNVVEKDAEEINFQQKVEAWRDGATSYEEVRQTLPTHDKPLIVRVASSLRPRKNP